MIHAKFILSLFGALSVHCAWGDQPTLKLYDEASERVFKVGIAGSLDAELQGHGTGFVVDKAGFIATAYHVVAPTLARK